MLCELSAVFYLALGNLHFVSKEDTFQATNHCNQFLFRRLLLACIDAIKLRLNLHIGGVIGSLSISWCGHLLHDVSLQIHAFTFLGGLNSNTISTYLTDLAHHHVAMGIFFAWSSHVYLSYFKGFAHRLRDVLFVNGNSGLMILIYGKSLDLQLSLAYVNISILTSVVAQHLYALSPYLYWISDTLILISNYVHHSWIASRLMMGSFVHGSLFLIRDYAKISLQLLMANEHIANLDYVYRIIELKPTIISHFCWLSLWIGFHFLVLYIHNDTIAAFGEQAKQLLIEPVFGQVISLGKGFYNRTNNVNEIFDSLLIPIGPGDLILVPAIWTS